MVPPWLKAKARFYSPLLGRFVQPDTITPDGPQGLNRFSYVGNNPINYSDPSGHMRTDDSGDGCILCPKPKPTNSPSPSEGYLDAEKPKHYDSYNRDYIRTKTLPYFFASSRSKGMNADWNIINSVIKGAPK